jgi:hypothetical protein
MFLFKNSICQHFLLSVCCLHEVLSDWSGILTKNIAGSCGIELPILFSSIESIDTFVSIDDFDTFSIVSPITTDWDHQPTQAKLQSKANQNIITGKVGHNYGWS